MSRTQDQLAILQDAMNSRKQIELLTEETERLKEKLASRQELLNRLNKLCLAAATLAGSVDSGSSETEPSSLKLLSKLSESNAVEPTEPEDEQDAAKAIVGKYLNQILAVIFSIGEESQGNLNILTLINLEEKLQQLFAFAENKGIIPPTEENQGWKLQFAKHKPIADKIKSVMENDAAEE